ncbi:MAG: biosynthetic peptidoglycan transglycosylase [Beijerinckiaceae bacterium]
MSIVRIAKYIAALCAVAIVCVAFWQIFAVWHAQTRTPDLLRVWLAKPQPVAIASLPPERKAILLAIEDPGFYSHKGVDFASPGQGLTTITQALVKFLYFDPFVPGFAKIQQSLIARFVLDRQLSKDQQLALFINHARLGHRNGHEIIGFAEAAQFYFNKPFGQLDENEYIGLVGMLIGPNAIAPDRPAAYADRVYRIRSLLAGRCQATGVLDAAYRACGKPQ